MNLIINTLPILKVITLAAVFFVWFIRYENIVKEFEHFGYSPKLRDLVGILKISAVILIQTQSTLNIQVGSALLAILMLAAFITHLKVKNSIAEFAPSMTLLLFAVIFFFNA